MDEDYDDSGEFGLDDVFECDAHNLPDILSGFIEESPFLEAIGVDVLVEKFKKRFKINPISNDYSFAFGEFHAWINEVIIDRFHFCLNKMVNEGELEMTFDTKKNDFVFYKKDEGNA